MVSKGFREYATSSKTPDCQPPAQPVTARTDVHRHSSLPIVNADFRTERKNGRLTVEQDARRKFEKEEAVV